MTNKTLKDYLFEGGIKDKEFIHFLSTSKEYFIYNVNAIENHGNKIGIRVKYQNIQCKEKLFPFLLLSNHLNDSEYTEKCN